MHEVHVFQDFLRERLDLQQSWEKGIEISHIPSPPHINTTRQILFPPQRNWFYTWLLQDQVRFSFYLFLRGLEDTNLWWGWGLLYKPVYPRACLQCLVYKRQASCLTLHQLTELMTYLGKLCCFKWYFQGDRAIWDHNFS